MPDSNQMPDYYYLENKNAKYLGNSPVWWAKNGKGYTAYILGAHRFTKEEAEALVLKDPAKYEMFRCADVDNRLHLVFDFQDKRNLGTDAGCGWPGGYADNPHIRADLAAPDADFQEMLKWKSNYEHLNAHSREQAREIDRLKQDLAKVSIEAARLRKAARTADAGKAGVDDAFNEIFEKAVKVCFLGRTTGGTAGHDAELCDGLGALESALEKYNHLTAKAKTNE